jgi:hypothetical protein
VNYINSIAIGAAVPGINLGILKNLEVVLPPLPTQGDCAMLGGLLILGDSRLVAC